MYEVFARQMPFKILLEKGDLIIPPPPHTHTHTHTHSPVKIKALSEGAGVPKAALTGNFTYFRQWKLFEYSH